MNMHVVILSFNHPKLTAQCVLSALKLIPSEKIHVVHNGSTEAHITELRELFPEINHLVSFHNRGFSGGANLGLTAGFAQSEWILFITNDCELTRFSENNLEPGVYAPLIFKKGTEQVDSLGGAINSKNLNLRHLTSAHGLRANELFYIPGTAFFIHRTAFEKLNGFDESLGTYWEDVDFSLRAHKSNIKTGIFDSIWLRHKIGKTCHKDPYYTTYLYSRNQARIARRHFSNKALIEIKLAQKFCKRLSANIRRKDWVRTKLSLKAARDGFLEVSAESNIEITVK
jgi:GT2 family glycosyltransferase